LNGARREGHRSHDGDHQRRESPAPVPGAAESGVRGGGGHDQRLHDRDVQSAGEGGQAQREAAQRGVRQRPAHFAGPQGAQQEQENQRQPDGALGELRPGGNRQVSAQRECERRHQGREGAKPEFANQREHETRAQEVRGDVPELVDARQQAWVAQRDQRQHQVQWVEGGRLHLADEGVAREGVAVPERERAMLDAGDPKVRPGVEDVHALAFREHRELRGEQGFPKIERNQQQKQRQAHAC
jgi:hypothetical protein